MDDANEYRTTPTPAERKAGEGPRTGEAKLNRVRQDLYWAMHAAVERSVAHVESNPKRHAYRSKDVTFGLLNAFFAFVASGGLADSTTVRLGDLGDGANDKLAETDIASLADAFTKAIREDSDSK